MEHEKVQSSNIESIAYDPKTLVMEIRFKGTQEKPGGLYQYEGVRPQHHAALMNAESVGSHFHQHIRGKYETTKLPLPELAPDKKPDSRENDVSEVDG